MTILLIVLAVLAAGAWLAWRTWQKAGSALDQRVVLCGLGEFNERLKAEVAARRRPMEHLALTRMMCEVIEAVQQSRPDQGEAALVCPPDEAYRLACEELVALGRLTRGPDGAYLPRTSRSS